MITDHKLREGEAVWVSLPMESPGSIPMAARVVGEMPGSMWWINLNTIGQHLPQQYRRRELHPLDAESCPGLGLCPQCLGFGTTSPLVVPDYPYGVDEIPSPCPSCEGSGRPFLRVGIQREAQSVTGELSILPHSYVPPVLGVGTCLGCGHPPDAAHHSGWKP